MNRQDIKINKKKIACSLFGEKFIIHKRIVRFWRRRSLSNADCDA